MDLWAFRDDIAEEDRACAVAEAKSAEARRRRQQEDFAPLRAEFDTALLAAEANRLIHVIMRQHDRPTLNEMLEEYAKRMGFRIFIAYETMRVFSHSAATEQEVCRSMERERKQKGGVS